MIANADDQNNIYSTASPTKYELTFPPFILDNHEFAVDHNC